MLLSCRPVDKQFSVPHEASKSNWMSAACKYKHMVLPMCSNLVVLLTNRTSKASSRIGYSSLLRLSRLSQKHEDTLAPHGQCIFQIQHESCEMFAFEFKKCQTNISDNSSNLCCPSSTKDKEGGGV